MRGEDEQTTEDPLETAAEEVSDGEASDWGALAHSARTDRDRRLLDQLRIVSRIADVHRSLHDELPPGPCLAIREPDGAARHFLLGPDPVSIGRSATNDIEIKKRSLSRTHARIWREGKRYRVEDTGSRNGTWVNEVRLQAPHELLDGDEIRIGACRITFLAGGRPSDPGPVSGEGEPTPDPAEPD